MKSEMNKEYWRRFLEVLLVCKTTEKLDEFCHLFLTMNEREYLVDRYRIIESLLTTKQTQREMAQNLGVSITKITDGSKAVQIISNDLRDFMIKAINKCKKDVKTPTGKTDSKGKSID